MNIKKNQFYCLQFTNKNRLVEHRASHVNGQYRFEIWIDNRLSYDKTFPSLKDCLIEIKSNK